VYSDSPRPVLVDLQRHLERWHGALLAVGALAQPARRADQHQGVAALRGDAVGVDQLARVLDLQPRPIDCTGCWAWNPPASFWTVRAMQK